jgi:hypothetical protein
MSYDKKCFDLAAYFLDDATDLPFGQRAALERELAQVIHDVIEDFLGAAAVSRSLPSDDQIILEHMRQSHELAKKIQAELRAVYAGKWGPRKPESAGK